MRIALISIIGRCDDDPQSACGLLACGGRSIAARQIELAQAAGCEQVLCAAASFGNEFMTLQGEAGLHGISLEPLRDARDLMERAQKSHELLLISDGLFVDTPTAAELLAQGPGVLTLPSECGIPAGFERIDLHRAWAGALIVPGYLVGRLRELPADADPFSGLLRIALQERMPDRPVPPEWLDEGCWRYVRSEAEVAAVEPGWFRRRLSPVAPVQPTSWLARALLSRSGVTLFGQDRPQSMLWGAGLLLLLAATVLAWFGVDPLAFFAVAPALLCFAMAANITALERPMHIPRRPSKAVRWVRPVSDLTLLAVAALALDGSWYERLFPPAMLIGLLWDGYRPRREWEELLGDRGVLAVIFAVAAAFGVAAPAIMLAAVLLLLLRVAGRQRRAA